MADAYPSRETKKLRRITRACDYCHKRSIRCRFPGTNDKTRCQNCVDFDQPCRFDRVIKRRGAKPRSQTVSSIDKPESSPIIKQEATFEDVCRTPSIALPIPKAAWKAPYVASQAVIADLVEIYFEIAYPIFPFFHRPTFLRRVLDGEYQNNKYTFAATMAMCALVSARITDRAVYNPHWNTTLLAQTSSEVFYAAAVRECGNVGALDQVDFDLLRTCALLALTAIQYGRFREMHTHLGKYHTLVAMDGFHDEDNWPEDLGIVETEERRRLFWSVYTFDIFSAIMWNGVIRCREQQSNVSYTTELDDEFFDDSGYRPETTSSPESPIIIGPSPTHLSADVHTSSWLCGWNFTTDLYRVMEHVITHFRDKTRHKKSFLNDIFGESSAAPVSSVRESIMAMYNNLPQCFKETRAITCDSNRDRYGFQAANITATVQLLRMVLFSSGGATIEDRCKIASEVVDAFMRIPVQYLQAISSPLLHHLAGIGSILGSVFEEPMSESGYLQVRVVLLALAQLLENLDHGVHSTSSADNLRDIVDRVDRQMEEQRQGTAVRLFDTAQLTINGFSHLRSPFAVKSRKISNTSLSPSSEHRGSGSGSESYSGGSGTSGSTGINATLPTPLAINSAFLNEWPWSMDFMQFPES